MKNKQKSCNNCDFLVPISANDFKKYSTKAPRMCGIYGERVYSISDPKTIKPCYPCLYGKFLSSLLRFINRSKRKIKMLIRLEVCWNCKIKNTCDMHRLKHKDIFLSDCCGKDNGGFNAK